MRQVRVWSAQGICIVGLGVICVFLIVLFEYSFSFLVCGVLVPLLPTQSFLASFYVLLCVLHCYKLLLSALVKAWVRAPTCPPATDPTTAQSALLTVAQHVHDPPTNFANLDFELFRARIS